MVPVLFIGFVACESDGLFPAIEPEDSGVLTDTGVEPPDPVDAGAMPDADPELATEPVYVHTDNRLYSYDPMSNEATFVGTFHTEGGSLRGDVVDIAIDLQGRLFAGTQNRDIFRVDPRDASCLYMSTTDVGLTGMTFLSDGRLVTAGSEVAVVDLDTGLTVEELVPDEPYDTVGDIIGLPDGALYWSVQGVPPPVGDGVDGLVRIDPETGEVHYVGALSVNLLGLAYAYDKLYGFGPSGIAVVLDSSNAAVLEERTVEGRWFGATTNPVLW